MTEKTFKHDRRVGKMLVIPVYVNYQHDSATDNVAIAHPFVYQQGEDIEKQLGSFPQRENLQSLVFWVPGYFPDSMGRTFPWVPIINGKQMVVVELQRCLGSEQSQIDAAMKTLLEGDFVVGGMIQLKPPPPPYSNEPKMSNDTYDASQLVRSGKYTGRFFVFEAAWTQHLLWAFEPGTRIVNRLSADKKKAVAAFAAETMKKPAERTPADGSDLRK